MSNYKIGFERERQITFGEYIDLKVEMLRDEFCLKLNETELFHFYNLKTESEVDRYAHQLIMEKL